MISEKSKHTPRQTERKRERERKISSAKNARANNLSVESCQSNTEEEEEEEDPRTHRRITYSLRQIYLENVYRKKVQTHTHIRFHTEKFTKKVKKKRKKDRIHFYSREIHLTG